VLQKEAIIFVVRSQVVLFWCPKVLGDSGARWKTRDGPSCLWKLQCAVWRGNDAAPLHLTASCALTNCPSVTWKLRRRSGDLALFKLSVLGRWVVMHLFIFQR